MNTHSTTWSFFETVYCLNQASRPDRWNQAQSEFSRVGLTNVTRFLSLPADTPSHSFCLSQYAMLKTFLKTEGRVLLALEDDVVFKDLQALDAALTELKQWHILYLGANITDMVFGIKENQPVGVSPHLYRIRRAWTSHAIAYTREMV